MISGPDHHVEHLGLWSLQGSSYFPDMFPRAWSYWDTELGIWNELLIEGLIRSCTLQRSKMTETYIQVVSDRGRTGTKAPIILDLSFPFHFIDLTAIGLSLTGGSAHWVCAASPQFPPFWYVAVEWNVENFSWPCKVLRWLLRTSLGGRGGNLQGGQGRSKITVTGCFDSFTILFNHSSWVFYTLNFHIWPF